MTAAVAGRLAQLALFADLKPAQIEAIAHSHDEAVFSKGERVLRSGLSGGNFYLILDGEATVVAHGAKLRTLGRGDFFGEISALTGDTPSADVVADTMLRCFVIPGADLETLLVEWPQVMLRLLRVEARRLQTAGEWQS
ncbi:MAG: cyclic nucleotide-binding domain-containing protein [Gaiellaceae bacterium]